MLIDQFRKWDELEEHEKDRQGYVQRKIDEAREKMEAKEKSKRNAARLHLYGPLKRAGRKRAWRKAGGKATKRDEKGRFV